MHDLLRPALTPCALHLQVTYGARTYYLTCDALAPGAALSPLLQAALATQTGEQDDAACVDQVVVLRDIVRSGEQFLRADAASAGVGEEEVDSADVDDDDEDDDDEDEEDDDPAALRAQIAALQARLAAAEERAPKRRRV